MMLQSADKSKKPKIELTKELEKARSHLRRALMGMEQGTEGFKAICRVNIVISGVLFDHLEVRDMLARRFKGIGDLRINKDHPNYTEK